MPQFVEKIDLEIFLKKKVFPSTWVKKMFFLFLTPNGSIRPGKRFRNYSETFCPKNQKLHQKSCFHLYFGNFLNFHLKLKTIL